MDQSLLNQQSEEKRNIQIGLHRVQVAHFILSKLLFAVEPWIWAQESLEKK